MKIVRVPFAVSLALLAAAPAHAAVPPPKPPAPGARAPAAEPPPPPVAAPDQPKPVDTADPASPAPAPAPAPADAPKRSGADAQAWFDRLSLPSWIADSGMPVWAWVLLGLVAFTFLRGLLRGGDQRDLIGPPPHMRLGARANPPAPRRADPPQRG